MITREELIVRILAAMVTREATPYTDYADAVEREAARRRCRDLTARAIQLADIALPMIRDPRSSL